jgi:hypothetical protein
MVSVGFVFNEVLLKQVFLKAQNVKYSTIEHHDQVISTAASYSENPGFNPWPRGQPP